MKDSVKINKHELTAAVTFQVDIFNPRRRPLLVLLFASSAVPFDEEWEAL